MTFSFINKIFNYICCCTCFSFCCSDDLDNINNYQTMDNKNVSVSGTRSTSSSTLDTTTPRVSMDNIYNRYSLSDEENYNYVYNQMNYT